MQYAEIVWQAMNSPIGITVVAGLLCYGLSKLYIEKPEWKKYEGTIISAVKYAEKAIPDDADNTAVRRFDTALKYVIEVYQKYNKKAPSPKTELSIRDGISLTHQELESSGSL
jgi:hypothetical protein